MSSQSSPQTHEPTMEEILASIRKIISEDQAEPVQATAAPAAAPMQAVRSAPVAVAAIEEVEVEEVEEAEEETDILDLTQEVQEEPAEAQPAAYATGSEAGAEAETPQEEAADDGFISSDTRRAMNKAFEPLDTQPNEPPPALTAIDGNRLEAIFTQAIQGSVQPAVQDWVAKNSGNMVQHMKPVIREWMDQNLPPLIEKAVKAEIAAAVRSLMQRR
jgi:cell pole-organizing protein PopZ